MRGWNSDYVQYNEKLQLVPRRTAPYVVQPVYLVYENEKTYLIARHEKYRDFSHYRVDKIRNIQKREALKEPLGPLCDPYEYAKTKVYMYGGEVLDFILLCHRRFWMTSSIISAGKFKLSCRIRSILSRGEGQPRGRDLPGDAVCEVDGNPGTGLRQGRNEDNFQRRAEPL